MLTVWEIQVEKDAFEEAEKERRAREEEVINKKLLTSKILDMRS